MILKYCPGCVTTRTYTFQSPIMVATFGTSKYVVEFIDRKESEKELAENIYRHPTMGVRCLLEELGYELEDNETVGVIVTPAWMSEAARKGVPVSYRGVTAVLVRHMDGQLDNFESLFGRRSKAVVVDPSYLGDMKNPEFFQRVREYQSLGKERVESPALRHFCAVLGFDPKERHILKRSAMDPEQMDSLHSNRSVDPKELKKSVEAARSLPFVREVSVNPPELSITFDDVVHEDDYGEEHFIIKPRITVLWADGEVITWCRGRHPHVRRNGDICWGGFSSMVDEALQKLDIEDFSIVSWEFLNSYNPNDAYFLWEEDEQDGW